MSDIGMDRCHWHLGDDKVLRFWHGGEPVVDVVMTRDQMISLARDLLRGAAKAAEDAR